MGKDIKKTIEGIECVFHIWNVQQRMEFNTWLATEAGVNDLYGLNNEIIHLLDKRKGDTITRDEKARLLTLQRVSEQSDMKVLGYILKSPPIETIIKLDADIVDQIAVTCGLVSLGLTELEKKI